MTRTQIQLPEPLFKRLRSIAKAKDLSLAEIIRREMERYAETFPEDLEPKQPWKFPVLPRSGGGFKVDPATLHVEADAIEERCQSDEPAKC
ncbi:MAG: ribbon-helix-helix protein, CopG family [Luteolibacter sp.]